MAKKKPINVQDESEKHLAEDNAAVLFPTRGATIIGNLYNAPIKPIEIKPDALNAARSETWEKLNELSVEIGRYIQQMAMDIHESVQLVRTYGCEHVEEFDTAVRKTNSDFQRFITDFEKIKTRHVHQSGFIATPDALALALSIFEDYNQFKAYFEGTMHHTLISFTEYALEAQSLLKQKEEAQTNPVVEEVK